ncbi:MAG: HAMP domain-containing protein [Acidiferrobacterales bacterium]|nr:HAMP domain-containing protein [Acidiferrobacterales bacterium]
MAKRSYFNSLRGRITNRALFIGILPVVLIGGLAYYGLSSLISEAESGLEKSRTELLDKVVGASHNATASQVVEQLDNFLLERISDVVTWASAPNVVVAARGAAEFHRTRELPALSTDQIEKAFTDKKSLNLYPATDAYLTKQVERSPHFAEVFITDEYGYNVALTNPTSDFVQSDEEWWITAMDNGISVGDVEYDDSAGIWSVDISVRIDDDKTGKRLGVMKSVLGVSLIQAVADDRAAEVRNGSVTIANSSGLLLAETSTNHSVDRIMNPDNSLSASGDSAIRKALASQDEQGGYDIGETDVTGFARSAGEDFYGDAVQGFQGFNWIAIVSEPTASALEPIRDLTKVQTDLDTSRKNMLVYSAIAIVIISLVAVVLAHMLSSRIIAPLQQLQDAAERVAKGDTSKTVAIDSNDEIEDLAKIFDRMRNSVAILMSRYRKVQASRT